MWRELSIYSENLSCWHIFTNNMDKDIQEEYSAPVTKEDSAYSLDDKTKIQGDLSSGEKKVTDI